MEPLTFLVVPSVNVRGDPSNIEKILDLNLPDVVLSGMTLSGTVSPVTVAVGKAFIRGYYVEITVAETKALTASSTNYIYIQLIRNVNNEVTGAQVVANTTGNAPADSILIGKVVTDAGNNITSITGQRALRDTDGVIYLPQQGAAAADPEVLTDVKLYVRNIDANNQGIFAKIKVDGAIREVRVA